MKKNSNFKALVALFALFGTLGAFGAWPFSAMSKWKKEMKAKLDQGEHRELQIELINLRNKPNPTNQDKKKIAFLEILIEE